MSVPVLVLTAGASLGLGVVAAPAIAGALSVPITGAVVPTRITDLAGYLTSSSKGLGRQGKVRGLENPDLQQSTADDVGEDPNAQQSVGTVAAPNANVAGTAAASKAPITSSGTSAKPVATSDQKRMLAVVSFGAALFVSVGSFLLIRRVLS